MRSLRQRCRRTDLGRGGSRDGNAVDYQRVERAPQLVRRWGPLQLGQGAARVAELLRDREAARRLVELVDDDLAVAGGALNPSGRHVDVEVGAHGEAERSVRRPEVS